MRELRLVLLGLAALIALALSASFLMYAFRVPQTSVATAPPSEAPARRPVELPVQPKPTLSPGALKAARAAVEQAIAETPDYSRFFDRLKLAFPSEYETIMTALADGSGGSKDLNPDALMADAVASLRRTQGALAAKSSEATLAQIFVMQFKEMQALSVRDPHLCVAFLYGANGTGFLDFAAGNRPLIAEAATAGLEAMNSGRMDRIERASPSDADFRTLDRALVDKGLTRPQIDALLDGKTADPPIPDDQMCKAGMTYLETLAALPKDIREKLYGLAVDLMAKS